MLAPAMEWRKPRLSWFAGASRLQSRAMLTCLAAVPLSLLPERERQRWMPSSEPALRFGAIVSGILQCLIFFVLANLLRLTAVPLTIVLYFSVEGLVRLAGALAAGELLPTLPLYLASLLGAGRAARRELQSRPKVVPDVVESAAGDLMVRSCAAKDWNQFTTLRYQGVLYELAGEEQGDPARPFLYRLRPVPEGKLIRGIRDYSPDEGSGR